MMSQRVASQRDCVDTGMATVGRPLAEFRTFLASGRPPREVCRLVNSIIYDNKDLEIRGIRLPSLKENHNLFYDPREELAPRGQASRVVDPQFIRVGEDDFHLQKSSPAIDGGVTLKLIKTDIDGNARPQGKRFDIGAHEHMPAIKGLNE